jgi:uncharacterized protein YozE (UPF0346 family)
MPKKQKSVSSDAQLQMLADGVAGCIEAAPTAVLELEPLPEVQLMPSPVMEDVEVDRPPFGSWLLKQQQHRREWIAGLAKVAKSDHRFPKAGDVDQVREYLAKQGADGDAFEALDDAERDWLA